VRLRVARGVCRDACLPVDGNYIKDLNVLGRDIARTVLVDNSPYAYGYARSRLLIEKADLVEGLALPHRTLVTVALVPHADDG
jgi:hypothetical protein